jgi:hypothetical protein
MGINPEMRTQPLVRLGSNQRPLVPRALLATLATETRLAPRPPQIILLFTSGMEHETVT